MEELKQWLRENGLTVGSFLVTSGIGYLFGRGDRKKLIRQAAIRENQAYFIGTKDGAIKALNGILSDPAATMDLAMRKMEKQNPSSVKKF